MQAFGSLMKQCLEAVWATKNEQLAIANQRNTAHQIDAEDADAVYQEI
jgi:hypothetical protein